MVAVAVVGIVAMDEIQSFHTFDFFFFFFYLLFGPMDGMEAEDNSVLGYLYHRASGSSVIYPLPIKFGGGRFFFF